MNITNVQTSTDAAGYSVLRLHIDSREAWVQEPKETLLAAGIVVLLDAAGHWEATLTAEYRPAGGKPIAIRGGGTHPQLVEIVRRFLRGSH
jgi:hypothetical protein